MARNFLSVLLLVYAVIGLAQPPVPQLPQTYIDTTFNPPTGVARAAHTSADFKNALNSANPGDTIVLDAGATYQGNFTLPAKSNPNNKWIYIVGSALPSLPASGTRVNPANDAARMPKIVTPNVNAALTLSPGANHYRLVGLEIYSASTLGCAPASTPPQNCYSQALVYGGTVPGQTVVDSVTVDRCYLHGSPTIDVRRGVVANGSNFAIIDSYISDVHKSTYDSQAILAYYSPGPIKIVNNYLEATGENIMFCGTLTSNPFVASDIEIRNNYVFKPMAWAQVGVTLLPHNKWAVKNLFEIKLGRRILIDSNIFENVWVSGQTGFAFALGPRVAGTQTTQPMAVVDDITISNNVLKNVSSGFGISGHDDSCTPPACTTISEAKRIAIYNNLILLGDTTQPGYTIGAGYDFGFLLNKDVTDFVMQHNTVIPPPNLGYCNGAVNFNTPPPWWPTHSGTHNAWILDNVLCRQAKGAHGWVGQTSSTINDYLGDPQPPDPRFRGNVFYVPPSDKVYTLPPHNYTTAVRPTNSNDGEYRVGYNGKMETTDGRTAGVDKSKLAPAYSAESGIKLLPPSEAAKEPPERKR